MTVPKMSLYISTCRQTACLPSLQSSHNVRPDAGVIRRHCPPMSSGVQRCPMVSDGGGRRRLVRPTLKTGPRTSEPLRAGSFESVEVAAACIGPGAVVRPACLSGRRPRSKCRPCQIGRLIVGRDQGGPSPTGLLE